MDITATFDCIGTFTDREGNDKKATLAHYIFGKKGSLSGGIYLPADAQFPEEGIVITLSARGKDAKI